MTASLFIEWSATHRSVLQSTTQWSPLLRGGMTPEDIRTAPRTRKGYEAFQSFVHAEFPGQVFVDVTTEGSHGEQSHARIDVRMPFDDVIGTPGHFGLANIFASALELKAIHLLQSSGRTRVTGDRSTRKATERRIHLENIYAEYVRSRERREHQGGTHASPVRHSVREHLRQLKNGRVVYVRPHFRGTGEPTNNVTIV